MTPLQQQIKIMLHEQLSQDEKMVSKIHLLPDISVDGIVEYLSVTEEKAEELWRAFARRIEGGYIKHTRGNLNLGGIKIKSIGNLQSVGGDLVLFRTNITSLNNLQTVGGHLDIYNTSIVSLNNLQSVGGSFDLRGTPIKSLNNLQSVGKDLNLYATYIQSLGHLQSVGGCLYLPKNSIPQAELAKVQVDGEICYY